MGWSLSGGPRGMICCDICCVTRAIRGTDESVFAEGAGVGGRNRVGFWGDNNYCSLQNIDPGSFKLTSSALSGLF